MAMFTLFTSSLFLIKKNYKSIVSDVIKKFRSTCQVVTTKTVQKEGM